MTLCSGRATSSKVTKVRPVSQLFYEVKCDAIIKLLTLAKCRLLLGPPAYHLVDR